jgi:hypothetical protein
VVPAEVPDPDHRESQAGHAVLAFVVRRRGIRVAPPRGTRQETRDRRHEQ